MTDRCRDDSQPAHSYTIVRGPCHVVPYLASDAAAMYAPYDAFSITLLYTRDLVFNLRHRNQLVLAVIPSDDCVGCL